MATVSISHGTEGPHHDPYSYEEITVTRTSPHFTGSVTHHSGLSEWVQVESSKEMASCLYVRESDRLFSLLAGVTPAQARRAVERSRERRIRRHPCGTRHLEWADGYPGETLLCCRKCGTILTGHFDRSAVE